MRRRERGARRPWRQRQAQVPVRCERSFRSGGNHGAWREAQTAQQLAAATAAAQFAQEQVESLQKTNSEQHTHLAFVTTVAQSAREKIVSLELANADLRRQLDRPPPKEVIDVEANGALQVVALKGEWLKFSRILANMQNRRGKLMPGWVTVRLKPI